VSWKLLLLVSCAACYAPDVPECTLACTADTDCVNGQSCTSDGFCAAPSTQCGVRQLPNDAAEPAADAGHTPDGDAPVSVHVTVDGNGTVKASTGATCTNDCTFEVDQGMPMTFTATPGSHQMFQMWSGACAAQPALCHVTPDAAISVGAKFKGGD
jgi:hypothetical protein